MISLGCGGRSSFANFFACLRQYAKIRLRLVIDLLQRSTSGLSKVSFVVLGAFNCVVIRS